MHFHLCNRLQVQERRKASSLRLHWSAIPNSDIVNESRPCVSVVGVSHLSTDFKRLGENQGNGLFSNGIGNSLSTKTPSRKVFHCNDASQRKQRGAILQG